MRNLALIEICVSRRYPDTLFWKQLDHELPARTHVKWQVAHLRVGIPSFSCIPWCRGRFFFEERGSAQERKQYPLTRAQHSYVHTDGTISKGLTKNYKRAVSYLRPIAKTQNKMDSPTHNSRKFENIRRSAEKTGNLLPDVSRQGLTYNPVYNAATLTTRALVRRASFGAER